MRKCLGFLILFLFITKTSNASHAMGGEITYRCLGNDQYEVTFTFYRDCAGIPAPLSMDINISSASCGNNPAPVMIPFMAGSPMQLGYTCPSVITTCDSGVYVGIEQWVYQGIITLPAQCADWKFSHCENARNNSITTITGAGIDDLCVYALVNNVAGLCNNSPVFSNDPVPSGCVGNRLCISQGTFDSEGDSLAYELISPIKGAGPGDTVSYLNNLSHLQPIASSPPVTFNPVTGEICMQPIQSDVTIFAILVNEYRNGVLIGQVERDIQLNVLACNNNLPSLTGINGNPMLITPICAGEQSCFWIASVDGDVSNTTFITWDHSISNMTGTNLPGHHRDTLYLCWTPSISDTASNPFIFTATVSDDNCPYLGIQNKAYTIYVVDSGVCATVSVEPLSQQDLSIKIYPQPASDFLLIDFKNTSNNKYHLILINVLGETVFQSQLKDEKTSIDISSWKNGVYFSELIDENGRLISAEKTILVK